jgi:acylphosphatase
MHLCERGALPCWPAHEYAKGRTRAMNDPTGAQVRLEATVTGEVQGVGYRFFVLRVAQKLGLLGYVRNRADGGVEVIAEGSRRLLEELLRELQRGPRGGRVDDVRVMWRDAEGAFKDFRIVH